MTIVGAIGPGSGAALGLVGEHPCMEELRDGIRSAARLDAPAVVWGPTGSGKELVARALHQASPARGQPFLPVNLAAMPEPLVESELFGYRKGAFTGAVADRAGVFEAAGGGMVFLDEAGHVAPSVQVKLLRVVEYREVRRVGEAACRTAAFRLVVATQESPHALMEAREWREDLYYRLAVSVLRVPALRERRSDIPLLIEALSRTRGLPPVSHDARDLLVAFDWPGNVRQLQHALLKLAVIADGRPIGSEHVRRFLSSPNTGRSAGGAPSDPAAVTRRTERERLLGACDASGWDLGVAAARMGMSLATLYRRLRAAGVAIRYERRIRIRSFRTETNENSHDVTAAASGNPQSGHELP